MWKCCCPSCKWDGKRESKEDRAIFHSIGVHCMAHHINLAVQTLSKLLLVMHLENLLQCLFSYLLHSPKRHLEFTKLAKNMATKGNKIIWIVKLRWILMLNLAKKIMVEYKTFLVKMALDTPINQQAMLNYTFVTSNFCLDLCAFFHY